MKKSRQFAAAPMCFYCFLENVYTHMYSISTLFTKSIVHYIQE